MATAKKTARGRKQDRARVAGRQNYELRYGVEEDRALGGRREEGGQEGRQQPKAGREAARTLGRLSRRHFSGGGSLAVRRAFRAGVADRG